MGSAQDFLDRIRGVSTETEEQRGDRLRPEIRRQQFEAQNRERIESAQEDQAAAADPLNIAADTAERTAGRAARGAMGLLEFAGDVPSRIFGERGLGSPEFLGPSRAESAQVQAQAEENARNRMASGGTGSQIPEELRQEEIRREREKALEGQRGPFLGATGEEVTRPLRAAAYGAAGPLGLLTGMTTDPAAAQYLPAMREFETAIGGVAGGIRGAQEGTGILGGAARGAAQGFKGEERPTIAGTLPDTMTPEDKAALGSVLELGGMGLLHGRGKGEKSITRADALKNFVKEMEREQEFGTSRLMPGEEPRPLQPARETIGETAQQTLEKLSKRAQNAEPLSAPRATAQELLRRIEGAKEQRNPSEGFGAGTVGAAQRGAGAEGEPSGKGGGGKKPLSPEDRIQKLLDKEAALKAEFASAPGAFSKAEVQKKLVGWAKQRAKIAEEIAPAKAAEPRAEEPVSAAEPDWGQLGKWQREREAMRAEQRAALGPGEGFTPEEVKQFEEPTPRETAAQEDLVALREELDKAVEYRKSVEDDAARGMADPEEVADARKVEETAKQALDRIREPQVPPPAPTPQEPNLPSAEQAPQEAPLEATRSEETPPDMGLLSETLDRQRRETQATPATAEEALNRLREGAAPSTIPPAAAVTRETIGPRPAQQASGPIPAAEVARVKGLSDADLAAELQAAQDRAAKVRRHPNASDVVKQAQTAKVKFLLDEMLSRGGARRSNAPPPRSSYIPPGEVGVKKYPAPSSPQARGESPTAAPTGVSPAAPPGFGQGGEPPKAPPLGGEPPPPPPDDVQQREAFSRQMEQTKDPSLMQKGRALWDSFKKGWNTRFDYETTVNQFPEFKEQLHVYKARHLAAPSEAVDQVIRIVQPDGKPLSVEEYKTFEGLVLLEDFASRSERGIKELPGGLTRESVNKFLEEHRGDASPAVLKAYSNYESLMKRIGQRLVDMERLKPESLREKYFPHIVREFLDREALPGMPAEARQARRGYTLQARGSELDILGDFAESMVEHLGRTFRDDAMDKLVNEVVRSHGKLVKKGAPRPEGHRLWSPFMGRRLDLEKFPQDVRDFIQTTLQELFDGKATTDTFLEKLSKTDRDGLLYGFNGRKAYWIPDAIYDRLSKLKPKLADNEGIADAARLATRWVKFGLTVAGHAKYQLFNAIGDVANAYRNDITTLLRADQYVAKDAIGAIWQHHLWRNGKAPADSMLYELGRSFGVNRSGPTSSEIGSLVKDPKLAKYRQDVGFVGRAAGAVVGKLGRMFEERENTMRLATFARELDKQAPGWREAKTAAELEKSPGVKAAAKVAREFTVDYGRVTEFENRQLRQLWLPFYTYWRKNIPNWFNYVKDHPAKTALKFVLPLYAIQQWNNSGDNKQIEDSLDDWQRNQFHFVLPKAMRGATGNAIWTQAMPWDDLLQLTGFSDLPKTLKRDAELGVVPAIGEHLKEQIGLGTRDVGAMRSVVARLNPLARAAVESLFNYDTFYDRPILDHWESQLPWNEQLLLKGKHVAESLVTPIRQFGVPGLFPGVVQEKGKERLWRELGVPLFPVDLEKQQEKQFSRDIRESGAKATEPVAQEMVALHKVADAFRQRRLDQARQEWGSALDVYRQHGKSETDALEALNGIMKGASKSSPQKAWEAIPTAARPGAAAELLRRIRERRAAR